METMNLYKAVAEMKATAGTEGEFRIKYRKYNRDTGQGGDLVIVQRARCRPAPTSERVEHADHKLHFIDLDQSKPELMNRTCWQVLIVEYNGKALTLD